MPNDPKSREPEDPLPHGRIYFGHQSVGFNILDGLARLGARDAAFRLAVTEINTAESLPDRGLAHSRIGRNTDPHSKLDHFAALCEDGIGKWADIAFFKFCYVDMTEGTDVAAILARYQQVMTHLQQRFPKTCFLHVTTPLTAEPNLMTHCRSLLRGRRLRSQQDKNRVRHHYNVALRRWAAETGGAIFDLAALEASRPNRPARCVPALLRAYTDDGGHLNRAASERIAGELLRVLHDLAPPGARNADWTHKEPR